MKKKALIFYIFSDGHFHAASAIEKGLEGLESDIDIKMVNAFSYTNPILGKIINKAYLSVIKKKPEVWGNMYDNPDLLKKTKKARETVHKLNMSKIKRLIKSYSPDIVFCTQAFPCGMISDYKKTSGDNIPLVGVLTDHAPHSYWLHDEVDVYVAPSEEVKATLVEKGVSPEKIKVLGIPVDPSFARTKAKSRILKEMGLSPQGPVVLIMGGSQGLGSMEEVVRSLVEDEQHKYQLLIVTGSNKKLYNKLKKLEKKEKTDRMCVLSFVSNIDELMEVSDIIVTKPGGMTTAEALVKNLPIMIVKPIPGHERLNTDYLVQQGAAIEIKDHADIHGKINELFDSAAFMEGMKENAKRISTPDSALNIAKLIFD